MPSGAKRWFFKVQEDRSFLIYRNNAGNFEEHAKSNGTAYGRVTGLKEPDASAMKKVLEQKSNARADQYIQVGNIL